MVGRPFSFFRRHILILHGLGLFWEGLSLEKVPSFLKKQWSRSDRNLRIVLSFGHPIRKKRVVGLGLRFTPPRINQSINQPFIQVSISKSRCHQSIHQYLCALLKYHIFSDSWRSASSGGTVALRQLRLQGGLVNRSKSLKAFKMIDSNDPCLRFSGRGSALCRSSWAWNFKSGCSKLRKKQKTSWAAGRCRHWKWGKRHKTSILHSIGKQLYVWWRIEFVVGGPAFPSGTSREVPCRQGCNLTALQHSFEMSLLRMAVAMRHLALHDKYQVMRRLDVEATRQRQLEPDQPKSGRTRDAHLKRSSRGQWWHWRMRRPAWTTSILDCVC